MAMMQAFGDTLANYLQNGAAVHALYIAASTIFALVFNLL
jgi:hypothetical protein